MDKPDQILARILSGEASSEDILQLSNWLNKDEKNKEEFCLLKNYWDAEVSFKQSVAPTLSVETLLSKIDQQQKSIRKRRFFLIAASVAATITLLIAAGFFFLNKGEKANSQHLYTYLTDSSKSTITLNDGTKVILNKNSRLTYTDSFGEEVRSVSLDGEAYFEVTKDSLRPFVVEMGNTAIKVLGTTFTVKTDPDFITATLVSGSVCFESEKQQVTLNPNQQLIFDLSSNKIEIRSIDTSEAIAWKDGLLKYKSVSFSRLIADLEKNYKTTIIIENNKLTDPSITVSGSFSENQSLEQVLQVVARSLPFNWEMKDGTCRIR